VLSAAGQPSVSPDHVVPENVRALYNRCGGVVIEGGLPYAVRIVGPAECVPANRVILADNTVGDLAEEVLEQLSEGASRDWYIIAEVENGNYLVIDFGRRATGKCYDASGKPTRLQATCPLSPIP